ncbi:MAG TPA: tRNA (adenosine(37)-N6)-threonylcarbamoyltransferase complex transferase subunit TsaD [bacterium]|nr:tRNA (adenosine(37)-N6)-threonylcarbamoyltransferase complex transferase subunit TsaD [bacterium]
MLTLGVETSCDETSCAVLKGKNAILSNIISSSLFRHKPFGGVVPEIASRHCLEQADFVFKEALRQAKVKPADLDLIAVTQGPGLIGSLLVGVCFAKSLSYQLRIPLIAVNHLEAHLAAPFLFYQNGKAPRRIKEPGRFIGLLVSGGHTCLTLHEKNHTLLLGETVDDAVGEAYDKVAKMMGLGYPGGPIIDKLAYQGSSGRFRFTKPKQKNRFDFSFSGIKTAVLYEMQKFGFGEGRQGVRGSRTPRSGLRHHSEFKLPQSFIRDMAASFQKSCVNWLVEKTLDAAEDKKVKDVVAGGGVSANSLLRKVLTEEGMKRGMKVWFPPLSLTTDNAAMIARRGLELYRRGNRTKLHLTGDPNLKVA